MRDRFKEAVDKTNEEYPWFYSTIVAAMFIFLLVIVGWHMFGDDTPVVSDNMLSYATNMWTDVISIGVGVFIIDQISRYRSRLSEEKAEKQRLLIALASKDNAIALNALEQMRANNWHKDGTLRGANLTGANLQGAFLQNADLQDANLTNAQLQCARLWGTNLEGARLEEANLQGASLVGANLKSALLANTNLQGASLYKAKLLNARIHNQRTFSRLYETKLQAIDRKGTNVKTAIFDKDTVMPDAVIIGSDDDGVVLYDKYWTPTTFMTRYTDPDIHKLFYSNWLLRTMFDRLAQKTAGSKPAATEG